MGRINLIIVRTEIVSRESSSGKGAEGGKRHKKTRIRICYNKIYEYIKHKIYGYTNPQVLLILCSNYSIEESEDYEYYVRRSCAD